MQHIIEGFLNFQKEIFPQRKELFRSLASSQNPKALFISCSDSRLVPELVTQQEPGQLFVIRNAGNIVPSFGPEPGGVSATIEYAVVALGVTDIVICGHSNCGAMKAIATCQCLEPMPAVSHWLRYADAAKAVVEKKTWASETDKVNGMVQENVIAQLNNIKTHPSVAVGLRDHTLRLHGWFYDIETGDIQALDKTRILVSLSEIRTSFRIKSFQGTEALQTLTTPRKFCQNGRRFADSGRPPTDSRRQTSPLYADKPQIIQPIGYLLLVSFFVLRVSIVRDPANAAWTCRERSGRGKLKRRPGGALGNV